MCVFGDVSWSLDPLPGLCYEYSMVYIMGGCKIKKL